MESTRTKNHPSNVSIHVAPLETSKSIDDDGHPKRTGDVWTASAHIITAVIGSGVLSLAWATAQLGWIAGPIVMIAFAVITYYTSTLLAYCYRAGDPITGKRSYSYMDAVRSNLSPLYVKICGYFQYVNLFGVGISYTIASATSMMAIKRSICFHRSNGKSPCDSNSYPYMIIYGIIEIILSQIPNFNQLWWLSFLAAAMSFSYSSIGLGLSITKVVENGAFGGTLAGVPVGSDVSPVDKIWQSFQALGDIAFAYSYSMILIEIQDTIKAPPSEYKTMKKATAISSAVTTVFYMMCGGFGYGAFGNAAPGNLLTGFGLYNPYWLVDIANAAIVVHLVGAYQVFSQPFYAFVEAKATEWYPSSRFFTKETVVIMPFSGPYKVNSFRIVSRTVYVVASTVISMLLPFFNDIVGLLGALGFWPLTVYLPVEMYITQRRVEKWSTMWVWLQILSIASFVITVAATAGSVAGIVADAKNAKPFQSV